MNIAAALTFAVLLVALLVTHNVADHWFQTHHQACTKGSDGWAGRMACARHVATYTAATAGMVGLLAGLHLVEVSWTGFIVGQLVSAVTHYIADRRTPLLALAELIAHGDYYHFGAPRPGHDDNPSVGTGAYTLDQAWHAFWLLVAALLTALI
ncbi:DUF3307 domain-containing protein [Kutzneria sp. NPDC051319]|uniref:DUF3307 domain-containing protein n=1 Tax=Kutzneria sp. NPDC051319 TaxID=3155047 RepID=UPI003422138A